MRDVMKHRIFVVTSQSGARFNGGDYDYGITRLLDWWTGEEVISYAWSSSSDFLYCPLGNGFSCSCQEGPHDAPGPHDRLWAQVDACHILGTLTDYGDEEDAVYRQGDR